MMMEASGLIVTEALFDVVSDAPDDDVRVRVIVSGSGLESRAVPLMAWVGDAQVLALSPLAGGGGFIGHLAEVPPTGAELKVGWAGREPIDTGVTFDGAPNV